MLVTIAKIKNLTVQEPQKLLLVTLIKVLSVRILKFVPMVGYSGLPCKNAFNYILKAHVTRWVLLITSKKIYTTLYVT